MATDALADLVTGEVGYPVPHRKPAEIAAVLGRWLKDPDRGARGVRARELILEQRSPAGEAERTERFYRRLLAARLTPPRAPACRGIVT